MSTDLRQSGMDVHLIPEGVKFVADVFTIVASAIAIFIFFAKRKALSAALQLLVNFSFQTTLTELKEKLERLNEYNANDSAQLSEIRNIFHEIVGQMRGNTYLKKRSPALIARIESFASGKALTEPKKRSLVSELREVIRTIQVDAIDINSPGGE